MFQLLPCSRCQRTFSVRSEVSDQALLKCPNCGNQFRLGDVLDAFYAPWVILENPGVADTPASAAVAGAAAAPTAAVASTETAAAQPAAVAEPAGLALETASEDEDRGLSLDGPDLELADQEESGIAIGGAGEGKPKTDWSQYKPITHEEFQRMKRADRSPIWSTLQVVLGGAAAIPVSLLLIWYVLDKDVAGAGPAVARYVPWIVPQKFRGQPATLEPAEPSAEPRRVPRRGESGFRKFDDVMPMDEKSDADSPSATQSDAKPAAGEDTVVGTLAEKEKPSDAAGDEPDASQAQRPTTDGAPPAPVANADAPGADAPMADVFTLLKRTKDKVDDWQEVAAADDNAKKEAAISLFEDLASLGAHFSSIPDTPGAPALARDKAQEIARGIKRQPDLAEVLQSADRAQLDGRLPRSKNGWVLVCTVGEFLEQDDTWRMMVADPSLLPLRLPTIEIPQSIAPQLTSGQRLLLLGTFVAPPSGIEAASAENSEDAAPAPEIFRASFSYGL